MSRMSDLLRNAAGDLRDGQSPLGPAFLDANEVTFNECLDMADFPPAGAEVVAWAIDNPRLASAALRGAKMETLLTLLERAAGR